jgi:GTP-binding protein
MDVKFVGSFTSGSLPPAGPAEVAVAGRSNVGKSSFINQLLGRRGIARVSSTPGKTRTLNFFLCDGDFMLVDLPGYGYSRASRAEQHRWSRDVDLYLTTRTALKGIILVGDVRHFPAANDREALRWLGELGKPLLAVLTKADKLGTGAARERLRDIAGLLSPMGIESELFSARSGLGRREVRKWIAKTLKA